jgi:hypothetical protein
MSCLTIIILFSLDATELGDVCNALEKPMKKAVRKTVEEVVFLVSFFSILCFSFWLFIDPLYLIISIQKEFEKLRIARTKEHFEKLQIPLSDMVRPPPQAKILQSSGSAINVGEWVEVEHCYEVGTCSDGGVAVVTAFGDCLASVRYVLDGKHEDKISISRLTTIPMPHRGKTAKLRARSNTPLVVVKERETKSKFLQMTPMDVLKWGLLHKRNVPKVKNPY